MSVDLLVILIARAREMCECPGVCGRAHAKGGGRCRTHHSPARPLAAVPREDVPPTVAAALPVADLLALCPGCHTAVQARRRKSRAHAAPLPDALFDLFNLG